MVKRPEAREGGSSPTHPNRPAKTASAPSFLEGLIDILQPPFAAMMSKVHWPQPLFPFQTEGVAFLYERSSALLADEMGLGKTVQALAAIHLLLASKQAREVLIVCPAPLVSQWSQHTCAWLPQLAEAHVVIRGAPGERRRLWRRSAPLRIVGYETLRADVEAGRLPAKAFDLVVLDEAQRIKNADTGLAATCKGLVRRRAWALTGTPLENRLEDLASILSFIHDGRDHDLTAGPSLRAIQHKVQLRRRKEDVLLDLPPKTVIEASLELTPEQRDAYGRLESAGKELLSAKGEEVSVMHVLTLITRLKQICNFCPSSGHSSKLGFVRETLKEVFANERQALLFSQYTSLATGVRRLGKELGPRVGLFHGGMPQADREQAVRAFKARETPVLAISLRAGGVGLNLQEASCVIHFDRWWNPAVEAQAEDRAHRYGQRLPVTVYRLVCSGTIEERICEVLRQKQDLFAELVDGASSPDPARFSVSELFGLLDLEVPEHLRDGK